MKKICAIIFLISATSLVWGQQKEIDSLRAIINLQKGDTAEVNALAYLDILQSPTYPQTSYAQQGLSLARKINYRKGEADCLLVLAGRQSNFIEGIRSGLNALSICENLKDNTGIASAHLVLQGIYREAGDYQNALIHAFAGEQIAQASNVRGKIVFRGHRLAPLFLAEISQTHILEDKLDSSEIYIQKSIALNETFNGTPWGFPVYLLATIQTMRGNYNLALKNFHTAKSFSIQNGFPKDTIQIFAGMSTLFRKTNQFDSAIYYAQIVEKNWSPESETKNLLEALTNLSFSYKLKGEKDSAIKYIEFSHTIKDSIFSREKDRELQSLTFNEQMKQQEIVAAQAKYKSKIQLYILVSGMFVLLLIAAILWSNNRHRQKAFIILEKQKQETDNQKNKVEHTLEELKATQKQLIQREKMASLGELTAGIAHEIQNPLNFVNNFSNVNTELIEELEQEADKGNIDEVKLIANDIKENEQKINHHGHRADAIVKGMLQHSRASSGKKEPTDINALTDEYLRLSYHGLRAKDKSFNADFKTEFDESIGKVEVAPQDIGRVLLNLYNNAFYSVNEKKKQLNGTFEPAVEVRTKKVGNKVEVSVKDNGVGIPAKVLDKIYQPFFTTKPTGQGTGLGLSLSYDIIKAHGGELRVETKEGEGAEFIIQLTVNA